MVWFEVHNALDSGRISECSVTTDDAVYLRAPAGWVTYQDSRQVGWYSPSLLCQIEAGESLGGFGFTMQEVPHTLGWWILAETWIGYGQVTPVPVPEPSSLAALALGLLAAGMGWRWRPLCE